MGRRVNAFSPLEPHPRALRQVLVALVLTMNPAFQTASGSDAAADGAPPPYWPDAVHVNQGCYLSMLVYRARFARAYPAERALALRVQPRCIDTAHTMTLLSWRGAWWVRDEYAGVFPLGWPVADEIPLELLVRRATMRFERKAVAALRGSALATRGGANRRMPLAARERDVRLAETLLPFPSTIVRVRCGEGELPFLFFRTSQCGIAVYDPATGTVTADCPASDVAGIVRQIAERLGYAPTRTNLSARPASALGAASE